MLAENNIEYSTISPCIYHLFDVLIRHDYFFGLRAFRVELDVKCLSHLVTQRGWSCFKTLDLQGPKVGQ